MYKNKFFTLLFLFISLAIMVSCSDDDTPEVEGDCDSVTATYDDSVKAIVDATCAYAGCHNGSASNIPEASKDYTSYSAMKATLDSGAFNSRALVSKNMPPSSVPTGAPTELSTAQIEILTCWHEAGYPEN